MLDGPHRRALVLLLFCRSYLNTVIGHLMEEIPENVPSGER